MSVKLSISTEEAQIVLDCLSYVRRNLVADSSSMSFRFVGGMPFGMSFRDGCNIDFLKDYIETQVELTLNTHPINPFIKTF